MALYEAGLGRQAGTADNEQEQLYTGVELEHIVSLKSNHVTRVRAHCYTLRI